ncbi:hypothetical protein Tco_0501810 [Tanacetum coccineum]
MVKRDDEIKVLGEINLELQSGTHKVIEKLSQEKVSQEEALEKFNWMVERDDEIKVLRDINVELESGIKKLRENLSQEEDTNEEDLKKFNSTLDNVLEKLSQEKDSPDDFYGFMYDTDDDASISGKSCEYFGWDWPEKDSPGIEVDWQDNPLHETKDFFIELDQSIQVVVVQNNVQQEVDGEVILYPPVHEDVTEEVIEMTNDQAKALSDQEVADECLDDEQVEEKRPSKRIRVTQKDMVKDEKPNKGNSEYGHIASPYMRKIVIAQFICVVGRLLDINHLTLALMGVDLGNCCAKQMFVVECRLVRHGVVDACGCMR